MKHVLVTGGNGFIGRHVVEELRERGYITSILDRHKWATHAEIPPPYTGQYYFGDIKDATLVTDAVAHVDGVIHLAGVLGTQETIANPLPAAETNVLGGLNVINACAQYDAPLVNIAVGNYWMDNTYSITKNTVERFVNMKRQFDGRSMVSVRALNAYGPYQVPTTPYGPSRVRKIMPSFICRALSGEPIEVYGDGQQVMDMIYVTDVAKALVGALEMLDGSGPRDEPIEAGTGRRTTVRDIADLVAEAVRAKTGMLPEIRHLPMRPGEPERSVVVGDPKSLQVVGIMPSDLVRLEDGVTRTVGYFSEYLRSKE